MVRTLSHNVLDKFTTGWCSRRMLPEVAFVPLRVLLDVVYLLIGLGR